MGYTKQTWQDEILGSPEARYNITREDGSLLVAGAKIDLATAVEQAGTRVTAERMNHIEDGIANAGQEFETDPANIKPDGTAAVGVLETVARADHVHPSKIIPIAEGGTGVSDNSKLITQLGINPSEFNFDTTFNYNYRLGVTTTGFGTLPSGMDLGSWFALDNIVGGHFITQNIYGFSNDSTIFSMHTRMRYIDESSSWTKWYVVHKSGEFRQLSIDSAITSSITGGTIHYKRSSSVCEVIVNDLVVATQIPVWTGLTSLPFECRPEMAVNLFLITSDNVSSTCVYVNSEGFLHTKGSSISPGTYTGHVIFLTP